MRTATGHGCFGTGGRRWLARLELPVDERLTLDGCLRQVDFLDAEIAALDGEIATQALAWPEVLRLMSVPGVNVQTAATFMAAVGDIGRFSSPRKLVSYLGLDPRVRQSGRTPARDGRISKAGASEGIDTTTIRFTPARSPSFCRFRAELVRAIVVGDNGEADRHAQRLVALGRSLHLLFEASVQRAAHALPGPHSGRKSGNP